MIKLSTFKNIKINYLVYFVWFAGTLYTQTIAKVILGIIFGISSTFLAFFLAAFIFALPFLIILWVLNDHNRKSVLKYFKLNIPDNLLEQNFNMQTKGLSRILIVSILVAWLGLTFSIQNEYSYWMYRNLGVSSYYSKLGLSASAAGVLVLLSVLIIIWVYKGFQSEK
jgi:hypothetical protein